MLLNYPGGDVFDEFTARDIPYGYKEEKGDPSKKKDADKLQYPGQDGLLLGTNQIEVTPDALVTRIWRWNTYYNSKLRIVEGELLDLKERTKGVFHPFMLGIVLVVTLVLFVGVLAIDYAVLSEFWSKIYADEFGDVPPAFADSVVIKSLQVVVAALAFHFFFQSLSRPARKTFTIFVFIITLLFLLGLGLLNAANNLPAGSQLSVTSNEEEAAEQDQRILEALGIAEEEGQEGEGETPGGGEDGEGTTTEKEKEGLDFNDVYEISWFVTLGLIFVAVTSVAALVLHVAMRAAAGLFGRIDNEHSELRDVENKRDMRYRQRRARRAREWLISENARRDLLKSCLAAFEEGYLQGLLNENKGVVGRVFGGSRRPPVPEAAQGGQDGKQSTEQYLVTKLAASIKAVTDTELSDESSNRFVAHTSEGDDFVEEDDAKWDERNKTAKQRARDEGRKEREAMRGKKNGDAGDGDEK